MKGLVEHAQRRFSAMQTYPLLQLTEETLNTLVTLHEADGDLEAWEKMQVALTSEESLHLDYITSEVYCRSVRKY